MPKVRNKFEMVTTSTDLEDGAYRVVTSYLCAGFVVRSNRVVACAPILRRKLEYWMTVAVRVGG